MTEMRRLLDETSDELVAELLRSARDDAPQPGHKEQLLASLGAAGTSLAAATAAKAAGVSAAPAASAPSVAASATAAAAGSAATSSTVTGVAVAKWLGIGLLAGGAATGAVTGVSELTSTREPARVGAAALPSAVMEQSAEQRAAVPTDQQPEPVGPVQDHPSATRAEPSATATSSSPVAAEVRLLDQAREALARGDSSGALRVLREHQARFAGGVLGEEAELLRIGALLERGHSARAAELGRAFLDAHPTSPHQARVRGLLARAEQHRAVGQEPGLPQHQPRTVAPTGPSPVAPARSSSVASFPEE
jgi:hypothetical protein